MRVRYTLLFAALGLMAAAPAQAQNVVSVQLDSAVAKMRQQGFAPVGGPMTGSLNQSGSAQLQVALRAGVTYMIVGVCDQDCTDMDLVLSDAAGNVIDSDMELDDVPIVEFSGRGGTYSLDVRMATCSVEPCGYGVRIFAQQ